MAINLLVSERRILTKVKAYCEKRVEKVKTKQSLAPLSGPAAPEPMSITGMEDEEGSDELGAEKETESQNKADIKQLSTKESKAAENVELNGIKDDIQGNIDDVSEDLAEIEVAN